MRRLAVYLVLFLVTISAATGVHASTECEKWVHEYKNSLKHSPALHRASAAHHRLHHYVHRKLAQLKKKPTAPEKPRLLPAHHARPKMTREELLKKLELACGDLPEDKPQLGDIAKKEPADDFLAESRGDEDPIELASNDDNPIPLFAPPVYSTPGVPPPGGGGPGVPFMPPIGGGGKPPNTPVTSTSVPPTQPPSDVVPEPGTLVLLLTGIPAAAEAVRRRRRHKA